MDANGNGVGDMHGFRVNGTVDVTESCSDRERREKNRFWIEKPAHRFVVYFSVLVTAEVLVLITVHWIFPLV